MKTEYGSKEAALTPIQFDVDTVYVRENPRRISGGNEFSSELWEWEETVHPKDEYLQGVAETVEDTVTAVDSLTYGGEEHPLGPAFVASLIPTAFQIIMSHLDLTPSEALEIAEYHLRWQKGESYENKVRLQYGYDENGRAELWETSGRINNSQVPPDEAKNQFLKVVKAAAYKIEPAFLD